VVDQRHQLPASGFGGGFDEHSTDGVDAESLPVPLSLLDEVIVGPEFLEAKGR
jgi:hypothetical protein